jgi:hypothetical protein
MQVLFRQGFLYAEMLKYIYYVLKRLPTTQTKSLPATPANTRKITTDSPDLSRRRSSDVVRPHDNSPVARKEEVSAEVPKFGVSAESHRVSHFETPIFEKDKA